MLVAAALGAGAAGGVAACGEDRGSVEVEGGTGTGTDRTGTGARTGTAPRGETGTAPRGETGTGTERR